MAVVTQGDLALFGLTLFLVLAGLTFYFFNSFWKADLKRGVSPYTGLPLRPAQELTYLAKDKVTAYLRSLAEFENRPFEFDQAALCRETGRLFPNCATWTGKFDLDWSFIRKRYKGNFVSWGSLSAEKKAEIRKRHDPLTGFQTEFSSKNPSPRYVEDEYALERPGPLYVDPDTGVLLGWKVVPDTELEVLIVQKPKQIHLVSQKS